MQNHYFLAISAQQSLSGTYLEPIHPLGLRCLLMMQVPSTKSACNCSKYSFFFCLRQIKMYRSNAITLCAMNISSNTRFNAFVVVDCIFIPERFC